MKVYVYLQEIVFEMQKYEQETATKRSRKLNSALTNGKWFSRREVVHVVQWMSILCRNQALQKSITRRQIQPRTGRKVNVWCDADTCTFYLQPRNARYRFALFTIGDRSRRETTTPYLSSRGPLSAALTKVFRMQGIFRSTIFTWILARRSHVCNVQPFCIDIEAPGHSEGQKMIKTDYFSSNLF